MAEQKTNNGLDTKLNDLFGELMSSTVDESKPRYQNGLKEAADVALIREVSSRAGPYAALATIEGMEMKDETSRAAYLLVASVAEKMQLPLRNLLIDYCINKAGIDIEKKD